MSDTVNVSRIDWDEIHNERDKWKDEYFNLQKFANQYESERDALKAEFLADHKISMGNLET